MTSNKTHIGKVTLDKVNHNNSQDEIKEIKGFKPEQTQQYP